MPHDEEGPLLTQGHVELSTSDHTARVELFSHALHPGHVEIEIVIVPITEAAGLAKNFKAASTPCRFQVMQNSMICTRKDLHKESAHRQE